MLSDPLLVVGALARVFDELGIRYHVGGSLASSVYGIPRTTEDVDLVADVELPRVEALSQVLSTAFFVQTSTIREAVVRRASFNVIHLATLFKADVFIPQGDAWSREETERVRTEVLESSEGKVSLRFAGPEDTVLHKLLWYRRGGEVSDRQWSDVLGVLQVQRGSLDMGYLETWATALGVADLLRRAREEEA